MKSNIVDVTVFLHHETSQAILVSDSGNKETAVWLPKSMVEYEPATAIGKSDVYVVSLPEWKAKDAGLI